MEAQYAQGKEGRISTEIQPAAVARRGGLLPPTPAAEEGAAPGPEGAGGLEG